MTLARFRFLVCLAAAASFTSPVAADDAASLFQRLRPHVALETRIINGTTTTLAKWPWQVAIYHANAKGMAFICGGSVIEKGWVLSAAHCLDDRDPSHYRVLELSDEVPFDYEEPPVTGHLMKVEALDVHPKYDDVRSESDISLLRLKELARSLPVTLDVGGDEVHQAAGQPVVVTGWGFTRWVKPVYDEAGHLVKVVDATTDEQVPVDKFWTPDLKEAELPLVDGAACKQAYVGSGKSIDGRTLCAGYPEGGKDACQGDSGGPLVMRREGGYAQVGIVSWGAGCGVAGKPGVYTRVSAFADWIKDTTGRDLSLVANAEQQAAKHPPFPQAPVEPPPSAGGGDPDNRAHVSASFTEGDHVVIGQEVSITVTASEPGYLVVFDALADGSVTQIYPNAASLRTQTGKVADGNRLVAHKPLVLPDPRNFYAGFRYVVDPPRGGGALVAILSDKPLKSIDIPMLPKTVAAGDTAKIFVNRIGTELKRDLVVKQGHGARAGWSIDIHPYAVE